MLETLFSVVRLQLAQNVRSIRISQTFLKCGFDRNNNTFHTTFGIHGRDAQFLQAVYGYRQE
jgi:hypothetical protein